MNSRVLGTKRDVISGAAVSSILGNQKPGPDTDTEPKTECPSVSYYLPGVYGNNVNAGVASKKKRKRHQERLQELQNDSALRLAVQSHLLI